MPNGFPFPSPPTHNNDLHSTVWMKATQGSLHIVNILRIFMYYLIVEFSFKVWHFFFNIWDARVNDLSFLTFLLKKSPISLKPFYTIKSPTFNFSLQSQPWMKQRIQENRKWSLAEKALDHHTDSPCRFHRKFLNNSMGHIHINVGV